VNQGLGLCHGHPVRTSASLQSSSSSLRSRRTRSRHIGRSPSSGHRGKRRPADTLIRAPCVWATALKHRERLENPRVAEGPSPTFSVANDRHGNPIPNAPLFPLLPSVQIFFAAFCRALIEAVQLRSKIGRRFETCRYEALHLAAPFKLENDEDDWRTGESPKALANDRHGNPIPNAPLFPSLPSVQIFFAAFCRALIQAVQLRSKIRRRFETCRYEALHLAAPFKLKNDEDDWKTGESPKTLPNNHRGNPIPNAPLFPLLPSVQIFFTAFCRALIQAVQLRSKIGRRFETCRYEALHLTAPFKLENDEDDWKTGESPKTLPNNHRGNPIPNAPLFPLLPSVQIFFAAFCRALIEAVQAALLRFEPKDAFPSHRGIQAQFCASPL
jgi:hypothetical protein